MKKVFALLLGLGLFVACSSNDDGPEDPSDSFDRSAMLINWADNIIAPAYRDYVNKLDGLVNATNSFNANPTVDELQVLREAWLAGYLAFQEVSMFEIGMAETIALRNYTNIYPTDASAIDENITTGEYNLELPSTNDEQGFPALDYLLFGVASTDAGIVEVLSEANAKSYLSALVERMDEMANTVLSDWTSGYRDVFVSNDGSTATSSVNKMTNDFLFYYEKALRAGKIGIPAGVFSGTALSDRVEGLYSRVYSKQLFNAALDASENFFNGQHFGSTQKGESLASYLDYLNTIKDGEDLSGLVNTQFNLARTSASSLSDSFYQQVESDNTKMLMTYDELQKNVILLKVDMFSALNIRVDFVDADGD